MDNETEAVGTVAALWRYPVKSMQGEQLQSAEVNPGGTVGDRAYAVIDVETGKVASAKHPRKWGLLLECEAAFIEPPVAGRPVPAVRIAFPDGTTASSDEAGIDEVLSAQLGRAVTLTSVAPTNSTLEELWPDVEGLAPAEFIESTFSASIQAEVRAPRLSSLCASLSHSRSTAWSIGSKRMLARLTACREKFATLMLYVALFCRIQSAAATTSATVA